MSHQLAYNPRQEQQKRFSSSHVMTPRFITLSEENSLEPIAITSFASIQVTNQETALHSFQDEANELLSAFSDTVTPEHGCDVRHFHDSMVNVLASSDQKKANHGSVTQAFLRTLGSSQDRDTDDFLTHLEF
jgi:hypothetical protein